MKRIMRRLFAAMALLYCGLATPILMSCATGPAYKGGVPNLVGDDALGALLVAKPRLFLAALGATWDRAGLTKITGSDPMALFERVGSFAAGAAATIDPDRPWAIVALSLDEAASGTAPLRFMLELPIVGDPRTLVDSLGERGLVEVARAEGYIVLGTEKGPYAFPPAHAANLSALDRWPAESLALWLNPRGLHDADKFLRNAMQPSTSEGGATADAPFGGDRPFAGAFRGLLAAEPEPETDHPFTTAFRELLDGEVLAAEETRLAEEARLADEAKRNAETKVAEEAGSALLSDTMNILSQLSSFSAVLVPSRSGLVLRLAVEAEPGSQAAILLGKEALAPSALAWTARLPGQALLSASWSLDPAFVEELASLSSLLLGRVLPTLPSTEKTGLAELGSLGDLVTASTADSARWARALGSRGALTLDIDEKALGTLIAIYNGGGSGKEAVVDASIIPRFRYLAELRDVDGATAIMDGIPKSAGVAAILATMGGEGGPKDLSLEGSRMELGGFAWHELAPNFGSAIPSKLLPALTLRWRASKDGLAMTNEGPEALKALLSGVASSPSLATNASFAGIARSIPPRAQYIMALSARAIARLALPLAGTAFEGGRVDAEGFGTWVSWLAVERTGSVRGAVGGTDPAMPGALLEFGFGLGAGDIGELTKLAMAAKSTEPGITEENSQ